MYVRVAGRPSKLTPGIQQTVVDVFKRDPMSGEILCDAHGKLSTAHRQLTNSRGLDLWRGGCSLFKNWAMIVGRAMPAQGALNGRFAPTKS